MHIAILMAVGLAALGIFAIAGSLTGEKAGAARAAQIFIWFWLAASAVNAAFGVMQAGIPLLNEVAAFVPIFGVPAGTAWSLARWLVR